MPLFARLSWHTFSVRLSTLSAFSLLLEHIPSTYSTVQYRLMYIPFLTIRSLPHLLLSHFSSGLCFVWFAADSTDRVQRHATTLPSFWTRPVCWGGTHTAQQVSLSQVSIISLSCLSVNPGRNYGLHARWWEKPQAAILRGESGSEKGSTKAYIEIKWWHCCQGQQARTENVRTVECAQWCSSYGAKYISLHIF